MHRFTHGRLSVAYRESGSGPAILMLHNGGTSSTIWRNQLDALSDRRHAVALDLPGFGESPRVTPPPDLREMVELVAAFIEAHGLAPVMLVGNCMGSNIAAGVATADPDRVAAMLLVNPLTEATFSSGGLGVFHRMGKVAARPTRLLRSAVRRLPMVRPAAVEAVRFQLGDRGRAADLHHDPELVACATRADQLPALIDVLDDMGAYGTRDIEEVPPGVPTRIVWGAQNRVLSRRKGTHLGQLVHAERTDVLAGCGHLPMLEDPEALTALIVELAEAAGHTPLNQAGVSSGRQR
ncbi:MAG: alpha/beta fold hydrolase [Microthrixaceae bacterium]|nr:alpha/beta fold hydrolase [Microthrixaceae bacterium]